MPPLISALVFVLLASRAMALTSNATRGAGTADPLIPEPACSESAVAALPADPPACRGLIDAGAEDGGLVFMSPPDPLAGASTLRIAALSQSRTGEELLVTRTEARLRTFAPGSLEVCIPEGAQRAFPACGPGADRAAAVAAAAALNGACAEIAASLPPEPKISSSSKQDALPALLVWRLKAGGFGAGSAPVSRAGSAGQNQTARLQTVLRQPPAACAGLDAFPDGNSVKLVGEVAGKTFIIDASFDAAGSAVTLVSAASRTRSGGAFCMESETRSVPAAGPDLEARLSSELAALCSRP